MGFRDKIAANKTNDSTPTQDVAGNLVAFAGRPGDGYKDAGIPVSDLLLRSAFEQRGDMLVAVRPGIVERLRLGRPGQVLVADPTKLAGMSWQEAPSPGAAALADLTDVTLTSLTIGDGLVWDGSSWVNGAGGGGGASVLNDLLDVTIATPAVHHSLFYNGSGWVNRAPAVADLSDVSVTSPATGATLTWNGSSWIDGPINLALAAAVSGVLPFSNIERVVGPCVVGRTTGGGSGVVSAVTISDLSKLLSIFSATDIGGVPASGGGTTTFLRADGSWAEPPGTGGGGGGGFGYFPGGW